MLEVATKPHSRTLHRRRPPCKPGSRSRVLPGVVPAAGSGLRHQGGAADAAAAGDPGTASGDSRLAMLHTPRCYKLLKLAAGGRAAQGRASEVEPEVNTTQVTRPVVSLHTGANIIRFLIEALWIRPHHLVAQRTRPTWPHGALGVHSARPPAVRSAAAEQWQHRPGTEPPKGNALGRWGPLRGSARASPRRDCIIASCPAASRRLDTHAPNNHTNTTITAVAARARPSSRRPGATTPCWRRCAHARFGAGGRRPVVPQLPQGHNAPQRTIAYDRRQPGGRPSSAQCAAHACAARHAQAAAPIATFSSHADPWCAAAACPQARTPAAAAALPCCSGSHRRGATP